MLSKPTPKDAAGTPAFPERIATLRRRVLDADNGDGFLERETLLADAAAGTRSLPEGERYLAELELLLERLSTPLEPEDEFAGRMVMGRWPRTEGFRDIPWGLGSEGHITLPLETLFARGLEGLARDARDAADRLDTDDARFYARQATRAVDAIRRFALRYADSAEAAGRTRMAAELRRVPHGPAFDFHSALQSAWILHFVMSCVCGSRDFAPGRLDQSLLPFYRADLAAGRLTRAKAVESLALFFVKFNEIAGTATDNYRCQPTPCFSSKQYLTLGGCDAEGLCAFNELTEVLVEAAELVQLPQPTFNFRIDPDSPGSAWELAGRAAASLGPQCNFYHDRLPIGVLAAAGIAPDVARNYTFTACNRVDLPGLLHNRMCRIDVCENSPAWFREALLRVAGRQDVPESAAEAILGEFREIATERMIRENRERDGFPAKRPVFRLESLFLPECNRACRDILYGGGDSLRWRHAMFPGIATIGDSLVGIARMVDAEKRLSLAAFASLLERDFEGAEDFARELRERMPKFGNGNEEADGWTRRAAEALLDAAGKAGRETGFRMMSSLYSLEHHNAFGAALGATPDGRRAGEAVSENQSPVHGADRQGPLALLRSVARLPLDRCICGGLNLRLAVRPGPDVLAALAKGFFAMGGQHVGFTFATREKLEEARANPEAHRTLMVRKTGFSEFFVALSPQEQQETIDRTPHVWP